MKRSRMRKLAPVSYKQVQIEGGFWGERLCVNREITLPIEYKQCKATGRIDAFRLNWKPGEPDPPHVFWDSDVAKWIEAASYSIATHPDARLEKKVDDVIDLIAAAQQEDGYLNVHFTVVEPEKRWSNLRDRGKKLGYPGHEEIELALVKLYRATGCHSYLDLAKFFVDERGLKPNYFDKEAKERGDAPKLHKYGVYDYCQAHLPVREQKTAEGHAVRACYLYAGMADVAAETGDIKLLSACRSIWKNIVEKRMYIHGGIGSIRFGERFTIDYDLPNEDAYAETCAAIALVFFAHRMLQIEPDSQYSDVIERALYNGIISGVSLDGTRFFYDNYLASFPGIHRFACQKPPVRQEWFGCACCPPNLARLLASFGQYAYSQTASSIFVHLFVNGLASFQVCGQEVRLIQKTQYPWSGDVRIGVLPKSPATFTVAIRIPGWCKGARVTVNGETLESDSGIRKGYVRLRRRWQTGDCIELLFCMLVERVQAHPSVRHDSGRVALQRGPIVYCLEEKDNGKDLHDVLLPRHNELVTKKGSSDMLKGIPVIVGKAFRRDAGEWKGSLYRTSQYRLRPCEIMAIPYFMWANREDGEMLVWIREAEQQDELDRK